MLRLINEVAEIAPRGRGSDLGLALRTVFGLLHRRATCVLISDFMSAGFWPALTTLRRRHEVLAIRVGGPLDGGFPRTGGIELQDPESGRVIYAAGASRRFRNAYREYWEHHFRRLRDGCRRSRVELLEIAEGDDPGTALAAFFRRRRARRTVPRRA